MFVDRNDIRRADHVSPLSLAIHFRSMGCHNERVARTRKHAENKRNKSLRRKDGAGGSSGRHHSNSHSSSQHQGREASSSTQRPKIGCSSSHASSSNSLDPYPTASTSSTRSPSASSTSAFLDTQDSPAAATAWSGTTSPSGSSSTADLPPLGLKKLREKEKLSLIPEGQSRSGTQQVDSPSRPTFDSRTGQRSVSDSRTHSRTPSNATLGGGAGSVDGERDIRKQRSFDTSAAHDQQQQQQKFRRAQSPNLSQSQPSQRQERSASAMDDYSRPSTAGAAAAAAAAVGLSISRSASPNSLLGTSPTDRPPLMDRSPSRSDMSSGASPNGGLAAFSPPARSSSADTSTGVTGSLALPKANNKNANRRSGFYGVMAIPQVTSPGTSATQSSSLSPSGTSTAHSDTDKDQDDYFLVPQAQQTKAHEDGEADTSSRTVLASSGSGLDSGDEVNVQPLSINVSRAGSIGVSTPQRKQDQQQQKQWDTSSSTLASIDTTSSSSGFAQDSTSASASASGSSLVSSAEASQQPSQQAKSGHLSFYDPDVLVFLDAVNDSTPVSAGSTNRRSSKLFQGTPTKPSVDTSTSTSSPSNSTPQAQPPKSAATVANGTLTSPAASPRLSQFASRHLNLVAEGHLPAGTGPRQREGSPIVSSSGIGDSGDEAEEGEDNEEEEEEVEHLSPLAGGGASRRDSRSNYPYQGGNHGLGLSTGSSGSTRNRLHSSDTALTFNDGEEEEDHFSKDALRKVRESIRRSRGGSVSRGGAGPGEGAAADGMTLDVELVELLINELEHTKNKMKELQKNYNAIRVSPILPMYLYVAVC